MRVLHIHTNMDWGGGERQILELLKRLPAHGVTTRLLTPRGGPLFGRAVEAGIDTQPLPAWPRVCRLARRVREFAADALHLHDSGAAGIGGAASLGTGVPAVYSRRIASPLRRNPRSRRKYSPRRLAAVIAVSETVREEVLRAGYPAEGVFVVEDGLDLSALDAAPPSPGFRERFERPWLVGGVGKLSEKKNWGFLVRVAARMADDPAGPDVQWIVMGEGPERRALEAAIRERGLGDRVRLEGFVPDAERAMKTLDCLFFPSIREGASVTVREAMWLGIPVVAVDAPGTRESLGGCGHLVRDGDVESAARCVLDVLLDPERTGAMKRAAREAAGRRFGIEGTVAGTVEVYRRVLERVRQQ